MKVRFNEQGKGSYEFLTVVVTCLIVSSIFLFIIINNSEKEKIQVFKYNAKIIINGESIGQVASQTLNSMYVINNVTNLPVIRPVACLDKLEIIDIAKKIDTYNTSILPYEDCCTVFVPKHPVINPSLEETLKEEDKVDYEEILKETIDNTFIYKEEKKYENIL